MRDSRSCDSAVIATLGARRAPLTPDAPLIGEAVPGYAFASMFGLIAQGRTPMEGLRRIRDDVAAELHTPDLTARIRALGQEPIGSTVEEYNALIRNDMKRWEPIIKATGAKIE